MRHVVVQRTAVLLSIHTPYVDELTAKGALPWLQEDEAALLRAVDPRAFKTDALRATRMLANLIEEMPVTCAVVGVDVARSFFASKPFQHTILHGRLLMDAFGDWLLPRAGAIALVEQAVAMARRMRSRRRCDGSGALIARAPGVEVARVAEGTVRFLGEARAQLGAKPHEAVANGARITAPVEPVAGPLEHVLVVGGERGEVSTCAEALYALLSFARDERTRDAMIEEARQLGADDDAEELVNDLVRDGLLSRRQIS